MKYRRFSRQREQSDDVETDRYWSGDNHLRHLLGARRAVQDPGRAEHRLNCRGYRRPPADADELCRRRSENRTTLCSRRLLLLGLGLPIVTFSWLLFYRQYDDPQKGAAVRDFAACGLSNGQTFGEKLGYLPLPGEVAASGEQALGSVGR